MTLPAAGKHPSTAPKAILLNITIELLVKKEKLAKKGNPSHPQPLNKATLNTSKPSTSPSNAIKRTLFANFGRRMLGIKKEFENASIFGLKMISRLLLWTYIIHWIQQKTNH